MEKPASWQAVVWTTRLSGQALYWGLLGLLPKTSPLYIQSSHLKHHAEKHLPPHRTLCIVFIDPKVSIETNRDTMYSSSLCYLFLVISSVVRFAVAQYPCDYANACESDYACLCDQCANTIQCLVCGYQGSQPSQCLAFNAVSPIVAYLCVKPL